MHIPAILVRNADCTDCNGCADFAIGYRISDPYGLTTTDDRAQATVFPSYAAAHRAAGHGDYVVPANASIVDIARVIWGAR